MRPVTFASPIRRARAEQQASAREHEREEPEPAEEQPTTVSAHGGRDDRSCGGALDRAGAPGRSGCRARLDRPGQAGRLRGPYGLLRDGGRLGRPRRCYRLARRRRARGGRRRLIRGNDRRWRRRGCGSRARRRRRLRSRGMGIRCRRSARSGSVHSDEDRGSAPQSRSPPVRPAAQAARAPQP